MRRLHTFHMRSGARLRFRCKSVTVKTRDGVIHGYEITDLGRFQRYPLHVSIDDIVAVTHRRRWWVR